MTLGTRKKRVVGTAGHIDHGKTALVRALTGVDTDRLPEEKRRGITIDLGFASWFTDDYQIGFIDVPGHERFVKNMLAGVGGIDSALLVVAADESIKPQTREHFAICKLLGIRTGVVAITKSDLVEPDIIELVRLEIEEMVAGSFLDGKPIIAVSSTARTGLDDLRAALLGTIRFVDETGEALKPGERAFVQVRLESPVVAVAGDRFVIRRYSPAITIGGGDILDAHLPKLSRGTRGELLETLAAGTLQE